MSEFKIRPYAPLSRRVSLLFAVPAIISLLLYLTFLFVLNFSIDLSSTDFVSYWVSGKLLLAGRNPYDFTSQNLIGFQFYDDFSELNRTRVPPHGLALFSLFGLFPSTISLALFFVVNLFLLSYSFFNLASVYFRGVTIPKHVLVVLFFCIIASFPAIQTFHLGQISFLTLSGLILFIRRVSNKGITITQSFIGGFYLSITSIKPNLLFMLYAWIFFCSLRRRQFSTLLGLTTGVVAMSVIALALQPQIISFYLSDIDGTYTRYLTPTISAAVAHLLKLPPLYPAIFCIGISIILALIFSGIRSQPYYAIAIIVPISLILTPYAWTYEYILCAPLIFHVCSRIEYLPSFYSLTVLASLIFASLTLWSYAGSMMWLIWYPMTLVMIAVIVESRISNASKTHQ